MNTDVIISSRIRLARNFRDFNFPVMIRGTSDEQTVTRLCTAILNKLSGYRTLRMRDLSEDEIQSFTERYIISRYLAENINGAVSISDDDLLSVMMNEEDHIREQCIAKGFDLDGVYLRISQLDKVLAANLRFAGTNGFYYTACPTNLGTGMRASVMMFLPSLARHNRIRSLVEKAYDSGITVRGSLGEGSEATAYYFQISNSVTIGNPRAIIDRVKDFAQQVCDEETKLRRNDYMADPIKIKDRCLRALGILTHCSLLAYDEFCELISQVKIGIFYGVIFCNNSAAIDDLTVSARPFTLKLAGSEIGADSEEERRAVFVKQALNSLDCKEI